MFPAHLGTCRVKVMAIGWILTDNETEVPRGEVTCPRTHSKQQN